MKVELEREIEGTREDLHSQDMQAAENMKTLEIRLSPIGSAGDRGNRVR